MYIAYGTSISGNCYKVQLLLAQLGKPYLWRDVDILKGESRTPEFLAMNPNGRVPVLEVAPGKYLPESNAILCYLAEGTPYWSEERFEHADTLHWLFFEQYSHEPYIAVARFIQKFLPADHPRQAELPKLRERGYQALGVMEQRLANHPFLVGDHYSIADIALYGYTHVATDGGFSLEAYPAVRDWLARVEDQPGYVRMQAE